MKYKVCAHAGCETLIPITETYCEKHKPVDTNRNRKDYDKNRGSSKERGYSRQWQKIKDSKLREEPLCRICGAVATVVHHIDRNPFNYADENLMPLCRNCHEKLHGRRKENAIH